MAHLVSLICHGDLRAAFRLSRCFFIEGGLAWLPGILWRLDTNWRALRADTPWLERRPSEVAREHVRFTTQPLEHTDGHDDLLFEMLEAAGAPDILCFASDYPHWDFDDPGLHAQAPARGVARARDARERRRALRRAARPRRRVT